MRILHDVAFFANAWHCPRRSDAVRCMRSFLAPVLLLAACSFPPGSVDAPPPPSAAALGRIHFPITAGSAAVQDLFDQGLAWCYAFHHDEALRCFRAAAAADPSCAMACWGLAYAAGPHINNMSMTPEVAERAHAAARRAAELAPAATAIEQALIGAIGARYAWPAPEDRKQLDLAYAEAMRRVHAQHGDSPDVAALFAESLMNLRPWDLWRADGSPQPETPEILTVLERLLARHPEHPQANHLYIHAVEASPQPERAVAAGDRLGALAPAAGHLAHALARVRARRSLRGRGRSEPPRHRRRSAHRRAHRPAGLLRDLPRAQLPLPRLCGDVRRARRRSDRRLTTAGAGTAARGGAADGAVPRGVPGGAVRSAGALRSLAGDARCPRAAGLAEECAGVVALRPRSRLRGDRSARSRAGRA